MCLFRCYVKVYNCVLIFFFCENTIYSTFLVQLASLLSEPAKLWNFIKLKKSLVKSVNATYQLAYLKTPLISTSLLAASKMGTFGSRDPLPTSTTVPPEAVA